MRLIDADKLPKYTGYALSASEVAMAVENAPTIEAEPVRHGRWVFPYGGHKYKKCSSCGKTFYSISYDSTYCPNCGARMDGGEA